MKNGLLIWNVVLTLLTGYLLISHFGGKSGKGGTGKNGKVDTAAHSGQFRIAYFEMDSVANNFDMVKQVKNELAKKESENTAEIERMAKELQQRYNYYQKKQQDGTLTQQESETASAEIKKMDDDIKMRKQTLDQDYFDVKTRRENEVKKNIEAFIKKYNESRNYTYIMSYEPGLFYYRDTALNITADVVKGLNQEYGPAKKKDDK
jgi:outer membrane protein